MNNIEMLTVAAALPGPPPLDLTRVPDNDHPRARRARRYRSLGRRTGAEVASIGRQDGVSGGAGSGACAAGAPASPRTTRTALCP